MGKRSIFEFIFKVFLISQFTRVLSYNTVKGLIITLPLISSLTIIPKTNAQISVSIVTELLFQISG